MLLFWGTHIWQRNMLSGRYRVRVYVRWTETDLTRPRSNLAPGPQGQNHEIYVLICDIRNSSSWTCRVYGLGIQVKVLLHPPSPLRPPPPSPFLLLFLLSLNVDRIRYLFGLCKAWTKTGKRWSQTSWHAHPEWIRWPAPEEQGKVHEGEGRGEKGWSVAGYRQIVAFARADSYFSQLWLCYS